MKRTLLTLAVLLAMSSAATAESPQDAVLAALTEAAKAADPGFRGFSPEAGKAFFLATHTGGKPDTPSCTTCHTDNPAAAGRTRAGKPIEPMAVSVNPKRFTDLAEVRKWFGRNCNSVLGRDCTPREQGDVATWLIGQ